MRFQILVAAVALLSPTQGKKCLRWVCVGRIETLAADTSCPALALEYGMTLGHLEFKNKRHDCSTNFTVGSKVCLDSLDNPTTPLDVVTPPVVRNPDTVPIPQIVIAVPSCNGNWTTASACDAPCGESGNLQQTYIRTSDQNFQASLCPLNSTRTQTCTSNACICPQAPLLNCQLKQNNNNVLLCQLSTQPKVAAILQVTSGQSDLTIDKCSLSFTNTTWNVTQSITMNPLYNIPHYFNSTKININYVVNAHGESFNHCSGSYTDNRAIDTLLTKAGICSA